LNKKEMKKVRFNPVLNIIFEPENIANDLQKARMSDYQQKQADKARMERLLLSILSPDHRKKMFLRFY
jgi:hypothetical protein